MTASSIRVLVLGAQGQLGRALADVLPKSGFEVTSLGRVRLDITQREAVTERFQSLRPQVVINAAAYTAVDRAEDKPKMAFAINRDGAGNVAQAADLIKAPIIHISTDYVFDGKKGAPYCESDAPSAASVYGASKLAGEIAVAQGNTRHAILRVAWLVSPYGNNFVKTMLRLAAERPFLRVVDDQRGTPTFAHDAAGAIATVARNLVARPDDALLRGVFHLTNGGEATWCEFARAIVAQSTLSGGPNVPVHAITTAEYPTKALRPSDSRLDCAKIKRSHGVDMPDWQASLRKCVAELMNKDKPGGDRT